MTPLIPPHDSWDVFDSSKIQEWLSCPRKFLFKYRFGWTPTRPSLDLVHGEAIHRGMQQIYRAYEKSGSYADGYDDAIFAYLSHYSKHYFEDEWIFNIPKNPEGAKECFIQYPLVYPDDHFKLVDSEICGEVPISSTRVFTGKLDLLIEADGLLVVDHKTSKKRLSQITIDEHQSGVQFTTYNLIGYTYAISRGIDPKKFRGILVNYLTFLSSVKSGVSCEFDRFYVQKTEDQLEDFIVFLNYTIDKIMMEDELLLRETNVETHHPFPIFHRNPKNCTSYYRRCEYWDFCQYCVNPLKFGAFETPVGFRKEFWDPRHREEIKEKEEKKNNAD